jgi:hypothetical protein
MDDDRAFASESVGGSIRWGPALELSRATTRRPIAAVARLG